MRLVNLTGCRIIVTNERGNVEQIINPGKEQARLEGPAQSMDVDHVRVDHMQPDRITGLPAPEEGVIYIVNSDWWPGPPVARMS